jgi:hypothetical protein
MALTKIQSGSFDDGAIDTGDLAANISATYATYAAVAANLTPRIASVNVANSTWHVLDDTAVNTAGGYLVITGANFQSGAIAIVQDTNATSTTYVDETTLRAQVPAKTSGSYNLYVANPDGGTGIKILAVTYSNTPIWGTLATLDDQPTGTDFAINISANSDSNVTYTNTTALPAGTTLLANGYFYGAFTDDPNTVLTFTVNATDEENQDTPREFSVTVVASNANRAIFEGRYLANYSTFYNTIDYVSFSSTGNATDFGDLTVSRGNGAGISSTIRGILAGGLSTGVVRDDTIDYFIISSLGNATDFGNLVKGLYAPAGCSSSTRGIISGGQSLSGSVVRENIIQYITIDSAGNALDFGDLIDGTYFAYSFSNPTRGIIAGGNSASGSYNNVIQYITIASLGDTLDFGDLIGEDADGGGASNDIRGLMGGSSRNPLNTIQYITIATLGNATDFGDLSVARSGNSGAANPTRAIFAGGEASNVNQNVIDYVEINSLGNATDFGDLTVAGRGVTGISSNHGGLQ